MIPWVQREQLQKNPIAKKLCRIIAHKKSNLAVSADVSTMQELLDLAACIGPHICILKTHMDIINNFDAKRLPELKQIASQHNFLLFEDRKFADIGHTVKLQYEGGIHKIASWADMVNFHLMPGPLVLEGLKQAKGQSMRSFIILSEMSAKGHLMTEAYSGACVKLAQENPNDIIGFICQHQQSTDPRFIHFTPGVKLMSGEDSLGQQYRSPHVAIAEQGCDIIIVGRDIIGAQDWLLAAKRYQKAGWDAYESVQNRVKSPL